MQTAIKSLILSSDFGDFIFMKKTEAVWIQNRVQCDLDQWVLRIILERVFPKPKLHDAGRI